jgi:D-aminopeptidase
MFYITQACRVFCDAGERALELQATHAALYVRYKNSTNAGWTGFLPHTFALAERELKLKTSSVTDTLVRGIRLLGRCVRPAYLPCLGMSIPTLNR